MAHEVELAPYTTLAIGGPAGQFLDLRDEASLLEALRWATAQRMPVTVLGGGSNVVVADRGVRGLVIRVGLRGFDVESSGETALLTVGAGEPWDEVVERSLELGLVGLECLSGIPGTAGATPIQNVGAYGREISDVLEAVRVLDRTTLEAVALRPAELAFGYRTSRLRETPDRFVVLGVTFRLRHGEIAEVAYPELRHVLGGGWHDPTPARVREAVLELRRSKSMVIDPADPNRRSVGSFFINPVLEPAAAAELERRVADRGVGRPVPLYPGPSGGVKTSAAWLIEHSGFPMGFRWGRVGLSSRHCLALVNRGGATARELVELAREIRRAVADRFGIVLQPEPVFLGFDTPHPLDERRPGDEVHVVK